MPCHRERRSPRATEVFVLLPTLFFLSFVTPPASAAAPRDDVRALVERVQAFYEKTSDFTARFDQLYTYASFGRKQRSSGQVAFKKPGMMRWDYETPAPKTFVLAGQR